LGEESEPVKASPAAAVDYTVPARHEIVTFLPYWGIRMAVLKRFAKLKNSRHA